MDIEIDVSQITAMAQRYAGAQAIVTEELTKGVTRGQIVVLNDARRRVPVDTGRLRNSIVAPRPTRVGDAVVGQVGTNVEYAPYVERGTRPHFVPARYIGVWAQRHGFGNRGLIVSGKPRPYLVPALQNNAARVRQEITNAANAAMRRIGGGR